MPRSRLAARRNTGQFRVARRADCSYVPPVIVATSAAAITIEDDEVREVNRSTLASAAAEAVAAYTDNERDESSVEILIVVLIFAVIVFVELLFGNLIFR